MMPVHAGLAMVVLSLTGCASADTATTPVQKPAAVEQKSPVPPKPPSTQREDDAYVEFIKRVQAYLELHNRLENTLPRMPKETSPAVIDKHQRALAQLIQTERKTARRGDVFTPESEKAIKAILARIFGGPDGRQLKASINDENPGAVKLAVNQRYPDEIPMSTVPPQVLSALPKVPDDVEYRFIGDRLILLDVHAHTVIDFIDNALPA